MDADGVEISKPGESSFGAAAKDVKITTTIDTLVKGMLIFHHDGEAGISMWVPPDARDPCGAVIILKTLLETVKQSKTGLLALDNHDTEMVGEELLKMKKLTHMPQAPLPTGLGENSFLVTKGFDAMKSAIARKAERVLERLADGSLPVHADEL